MSRAITNSPGKVTLLASVTMPRQTRTERYRSFVYVFQGEATGMLKVGITTNLESRAMSLRTAGSGPLRLVALWRIAEKSTRSYQTYWSARLVEVDLHARLHFANLHGEWFAGTEEALDLISSLRGRRYPYPPRAAWDAPWGTVERRQWLEVFYDAIRVGADARAAVDEWADSRRRIAALKLSIAAQKTRNKKLRALPFQVIA